MAQAEVTEPRRPHDISVCAEETYTSLLPTRLGRQGVHTGCLNSQESQAEVPLSSVRDAWGAYCYEAQQTQYGRRPQGVTALGAVEWVYLLK
jgi:hypothetical protein